MYKKMAMIVALVLLYTPSVAQEHCKKIKKIPKSFNGQTVVPGTYKIVFVATKGSKKGKFTSGQLKLLRASLNDVSPTTKKQAAKGFIETPLYGWTDVDFTSVGAPMCAGAPHTDPKSTDPVYPGVLLHIMNPTLFKDYPLGTPLLTIGTLSNIRTGELWKDGCGIYLIVKKFEGNSFFGDWDAWGLLHDGSGFFCAHPVKE